VLQGAEDGRVREVVLRRRAGRGARRRDDHRQLEASARALDAGLPRVAARHDVREALIGELAPDVARDRVGAGAVEAPGRVDLPVIGGLPQRQDLLAGERRDDLGRFLDRQRLTER
jgi:hypothetical protein